MDERQSDLACVVPRWIAMNPKKTKRKKVLGESIGRIVIKMPSYIGDSVNTTPAIEILRQEYPQAHFTILCRPHIADLFRNREEIEEIIQGLFDVLANRNPEVKPKDDFKEKHPHYRRFLVDPSPPLKVPPEKKPQLNWKELLRDYQKERGYSLAPVKIKSPETQVPQGVICGVCRAPAKYLYFNDGKKRRQPKCKVCSSLSQVHLLLSPR